MRLAVCGLCLAVVCAVGWRSAGESKCSTAALGCEGESVAQPPSAVPRCEPVPNSRERLCYILPTNPVATEGKAEELNDPMSANGACYVCHMTFVRESLSKSHLKAKVGCVNCHGTSAKHANDENIGATKPDITFKRSGVDPMCIKCHEGHNAPARKVVARFLERKLSPNDTPTCSECHGEHKIMR